MKQENTGGWGWVLAFILLTGAMGYYAWHRFMAPEPTTKHYTTAPAGDTNDIQALKGGHCEGDSCMVNITAPVQNLKHLTLKQQINLKYHCMAETVEEVAHYNTYHIKVLDETTKANARELLKTPLDQEMIDFQTHVANGDTDFTVITHNPTIGKDTNIKNLCKAYRKEK